MKKLFLFPILGLFLITSFLPAQENAAAESGFYAVAPANGVWFYESPDEASGIFMLPRSYYVKIVTDGEPFCKVEYGDGQTLPLISGYCKREALKPVDFIPENPFLVKQVTLTYTLEGSEGDFDNLEKPFLFYGSTFRGTARYLYVYADGKFGYVASATEPDYELNTDYLTPDTGTTEPSDKKSVLTGVQIALACIAVGATLCAGGLVLFARKPAPVLREEEEEF